MCRKYRFIADIDNKKITDFVAYGSRLQRVYLIFGIIAIVNLVSTFKKEDHIIRLLQLLGIVCYAGIVACFLFMDTIKPNDRAMKGAVSSVLGLLVVNSTQCLATFIYMCAKYFTWTLLFSVVELLLQVATLYIFYHFRIAVDKEIESGSLTGLQPEPSAPVVAVAMSRPSNTSGTYSDKV